MRLTASVTAHDETNREIPGTGIAAETDGQRVFLPLDYLPVPGARYLRAETETDSWIIPVPIDPAEYPAVP